MKLSDPSVYFGMRFGKRVVLDQWKVGRGGNKYFLCRCDNGHEAWVKLAHLNAGSGNVCKTCHCQKIATRHGQARTSLETPLYKKWINMRSRASGDPSYVRRGITVCKRWELFENFVKDMGIPPDHRMQIDRKDGRRGYHKSNCRWVTRIQNNHNRINLRIISFKGMRMCVADWEKYLNVAPETLRKKLRFRRPINVIMAELGFA